MEKIRLIFERGGELLVYFTGLAPETEKLIKESLPIESVMKHSRYCGEEVFFGIETSSPPASENSKMSVDKFDVCYWLDEHNAGIPGNYLGTMSFFYGSETLNYKGGNIYVNIFGRIDKSQERQLDEIGLRIWQCGFEKVRVELVGA